MSLHLGSQACIAFVIEIIYKKVQSLNIIHYHAKSACTFTHALYYCLYSQWMQHDNCLSGHTVCRKVQKKQWDHNYRNSRLQNQKNHDDTQTPAHCQEQEDTQSYSSWGKKTSSTTHSDILLTSARWEEPITRPGWKS